MEERHEREQYFFSDQTVKDFADLLENYRKPCLLCAPTLGVEMHKRRKLCKTLDIDQRFGFLPTFQYWNIWRPVPLEETFDLILVDPPFSIVSLDQLFRAIRILAKNDYSMPIVLSHHESRVLDIEGVFAPFSLIRTSYSPRYKTTGCQAALFSNISDFNRIILCLEL